jgi:acyl-CoA oxidase
MLLHNIRVPKDNLLNKYVQISNSGEITSVGDPRIGYGTMMHVRELISCAVIKLYALAIIIAARYSLYRKQFRDAKKQEIPIIEYQAQQDKVISRIAEYYAVSVASTRIRLISESNSKKVLVNDFSLLQETHSNLAFSKCLFSEIVQDGIESCRRSMGGHGTSYYSGIPQLMNEYAANNTHEG